MLAILIDCRTATIRLLSLVTILMLPVLTAFGPPSLIESDAARAPVTAGVLRQAAASESPDIGARGGALMDAASGDIFWQREGDRRMAIASTTKIMTALVALEHGAPAMPIPVRVSAAEMPGSSVAGLRAGDRLLLSEMMYGLLLPSGNDAATNIAIAIGGSVQGFVALMNQRAAQLQLSNTRFANPHGLDSPDHYSSPRDLARLTRVALQNPIFAEIVSTRTHIARGQFVYEWTNTNQLLWRRPDATGVKTGTTDAAGDALVGSARQGSRSAIAVVLNSPDRWRESDALLTYFFHSLAPVQLRLPASPFYRGLDARIATAPTVPVWQSRLLDVVIRLDDGPRAASGPIGVADYSLAGRPVGETPLTRP